MSSPSSSSSSSFSDEFAYDSDESFISYANYMTSFDTTREIDMKPEKTESIDTVFLQPPPLPEEDEPLSPPPVIAPSTIPVSDPSSIAPPVDVSTPPSDGTGAYQSVLPLDPKAMKQDDEMINSIAMDEIDAPQTEDDGILEGETILNELGKAQNAETPIEIKSESAAEVLNETEVPTEVSDEAQVSDEVPKRSTEVSDEAQVSDEVPKRSTEVSDEAQVSDEVPKRSIEVSDEDQVPKRSIEVSDEDQVSDEVPNEASDVIIEAREFAKMLESTDPRSFLQSDAFEPLHDRVERIHAHGAKCILTTLIVFASRLNLNPKDTLKHLDESMTYCGTRDGTSLYKEVKRKLMTTPQHTPEKDSDDDESSSSSDSFSSTSSVVSLIGQPVTPRPPQPVYPTRIADMHFTTEIPQTVMNALYKNVTAARPNQYSVEPCPPDKVQEAFQRFKAMVGHSL